MNRQPTADQIAMNILLDVRLSPKQRDAKLSKFARELRDHAEGRVECPGCGSMGPHDGNDDHLDPQFCCADCGMHFEDPGVAVP